MTSSEFWFSPAIAYSIALGFSLAACSVKREALLSLLRPQPPFGNFITTGQQVVFI
jgi:hypothetical protein